MLITMSQPTQKDSRKKQTSPLEQNSSSEKHCSKFYSI